MSDFRAMGMVVLGSVIPPDPDPVSLLDDLNVLTRWVLLDGTNLFVLTGQGGINPQKSLALYDFTDPSNITLVKTSGVQSASWIGIDRVEFVKRGNYIIFPDYTDDIFSIDTTTTPMSFADQETFAGFGTMFWCQYVQNNHVMATAGGTRVVLIDVSDPTDLTLSDDTTLGGGADEWISAPLVDGTLVVAAINPAFGTDYFGVWDFSIPGVIPSSPIGTLGVSLGTFGMQVAQDGYTYLATGNPVRLLIHSFTTPSSPAVVFNDVVPGIPSTPLGSPSSRIFVVGDILFLALNDGSVLKLCLIDVSDRSDPEVISVFNTGITMNAGPRGIWVYGDYIFVAAQVSSVERLYVYELV